MLRIVSSSDNIIAQFETRAMAWRGALQHCTLSPLNSSHYNQIFSEAQIFSYLRPAVQQQPRHLHVTVHAGLHQGRVHLVSLNIQYQYYYLELQFIIMYHHLVLLIRPRLQQEPHHLEVALVAGQGQGRLLELVAENI